MSSTGMLGLCEDKSQTLAINPITSKQCSNVCGFRCQLRKRGGGDSLFGSGTS